MKSIMISIKPRFVADILNGKKTIEIRELTNLIQVNQTKEKYEYTPSSVRGEIHDTIVYLCQLVRENK